MQAVNELPTHIAVREAVVNTLIHANYNESTAVLITKWPDRFEFRNPGTMRVRPTKAGSSDCRNRNLQRMFMFVGYSEQAGSCYQKILSGWRGEHWADPFISDDVDETYEAVSGLLAIFRGMKVIGKMRCVKLYFASMLMDKLDEAERKGWIEA